MHKEWRKKEHKYAHGSYLNIGRVTAVASYDWNPAKRDDPKPWKLHVALPGLTFKEGFTHTATEEEAKAQIERAVDRWLEWLNHEDLQEGQLL